MRVVVQESTLNYTYTETFLITIDPILGNLTDTPQQQPIGLVLLGPPH